MNLISLSPPGRASRFQALGMTLAEVVVALAISGMMVASLVGGYTYSTVSGEKARLSLAANTRALEDTHAAIWNISGWPVVDQLVATNFRPKQVTIHRSAQTGAITYGTNYTTITQVSLSPQLRRVRVDCVWGFQSGKFSSLLTNTVETLRGPD
jgi:type II secretory pathway pseudopilin PulG